MDKELPPQNYERINKKIREEFSKLVEESPEKLEKDLKFSWSNWGFGQEDLSVTANRLREAGIEYIELHGNKYGEDLGYDSSEVMEVLKNNGLKVSGICGMFYSDRDLSSDKGWVRQNAIDYIKRNVELGKEHGAEYFLIVPGAVGRPDPIDEYEMDRSVDTLRRVADIFTKTGIKGVIEPIRSAEVSFCHTFEDAVDYIKRLNHPGVQGINGDVYHMMQEESNIGETIRKHGDRLINLHLADSNRRALGSGMLDLDTVLMSLYLIGFNEGAKFVTAEPLGPGGNPYHAICAKHDPKKLDKLVNETVDYFRSREKIIKKTIEKR